MLNFKLCYSHCWSNRNHPFRLPTCVLQHELEPWNESLMPYLMCVVSSVWKATSTHRQLLLKSLQMDSKHMLESYFWAVWFETCGLKKLLKGVRPSSPLAILCCDCSYLDQKQGKFSGKKKTTKELPLNCTSPGKGAWRKKRLFVTWWELQTATALQTSWCRGLENGSPRQKGTLNTSHS